MSEPLSPDQALRLIDTCPIPLLVLDKHRVIRSCNPAFSDMIGKKQAEALIGQSAGALPCNPLLGADTRASWTGADGQLRHYAIHRTETGGADTLEVRYFIDITHQCALEQSQQALREELREHTLTDSVTGLLNQRGVMLALEPQVARSRRYNSPISLITLDVQGAGRHDMLRKRVAQQLKDQLRWADLVGSDDHQAFILVLPETAQEAALRLAEKLHAQLVELLQHEFPEHDISVVYGVTGWHRTDSATTLLRRARQALEQTAPGQDQPVAL